jgi:16S rRNA processing protein RimM
MLPVNDLILIGKVSGTHGIRGQVRVVPYSGLPDSILSLSTFFLQMPDGSYKSFEIAGASEHKKRVLVTLKGFNDINFVLGLVGCEIYIDRAQLPELPEGEYYWQDLIGLEVLTDRGDSLGELVHIFETGSNDIYVVKAGNHEYLIPAISDVVLDIDLDARKMTVCPPDGLLDL